MVVKRESSATPIRSAARVFARGGVLLHASSDNTLSAVFIGLGMFAIFVG